MNLNFVFKYYIYVILRNNLNIMLCAARKNAITLIDYYGLQFS